MIRRRSLFALLVFGILIGATFWLPAALMASLLPSDVTCKALSGTLWRGRCSDLQIRGSRSGDLSWQVGLSLANPMAPHLRMRWTKDQSMAAGTLNLPWLVASSLDLHSLSVDLQTLRNALPADVRLGPLAGLAGRLDASNLQIALDQGRVTSLQGEATLSQAVWLQTGSAIGPFEANFQGRNGVLRDRGGPLALSATVLLDAPGSFKAKVRAEARVSGVFPGLLPGTPVEAEVDGRF